MASSHDPYEDLNGSSHGSILRRYRVFSKHNRDLLITVVLFSLLLISAALAAYRNLGDNPATATQLILGSAILGGFVTIANRALDAAQKRLAIADLFVGEISSIGRAFIAANIVGRFISLYAGISASPGTFKFALADASRKENYFSVFEKNCGDLGVLSSHIVEDVAAFYTFLKASRDATGALSKWNEDYYSDETKKRDLIGVIYCCWLMAIHGRKAITKIVENEHKADHMEARFLTIELQCFLFLDLVVPREDPRYSLLGTRREKYEPYAKAFREADELPLLKSVAV